ncbi:hypothetical protein B0J13DRAFT_517625 [Dactylonectria estremocensis]|uniref:Uncharacterized protein n=1 Tax=Dactylonectria estremocensis TaxID=1079267 RepID=A0A9P9FIY6_9HYPO|nr:hypothetical protein B0J13DRAFT_517625 [Dactylonectria estremocensis]
MRARVTDFLPSRVTIVFNSEMQPVSLIRAGLPTCHCPIDFFLSLCTLSWYLSPPAHCAPLNPPAPGPPQMRATLGDDSRHARHGHIAGVVFGQPAQWLGSYVMGGRPSWFMLVAEKRVVKLTRLDPRNRTSEPGAYILTDAACFRRGTCIRRDTVPLVVFLKGFCLSMDAFQGQPTLQSIVRSIGAPRSTETLGASVSQLYFVVRLEQA